MDVLACKAVPLLRIRMVVGFIGPRENTHFAIRESKEGGMTFYLPTRIRKNIAIGDTLDVMCIPMPDMRMDNHVFAANKIVGNDEPQLLFSEKAFDGVF